MFFTKLSDDCEAVIALAKTCSYFYTIFHTDKTSRLAYAEGVVEKAIGFKSPHIVRLGILKTKIQAKNKDFKATGLEPYARKCWSFPATDLMIAQSAEFEQLIRKSYQIALDNEYKMLAPELPFSARQLENSMTYRIWDAVFEPPIVWCQWRRNGFSNSYGPCTTDYALWYASVVSGQLRR